MKILFTPGHGLAIHIDGQLAGVITKPGASISPDENGFYDCTESLSGVLDYYCVNNWTGYKLKVKSQGMPDVSLSASYIQEGHFVSFTVKDGEHEGSNVNPMIKLTPVLIY